MPLVRITLAQGTSPEHRRAIADGVHQALMETANVPEDDRFQVVQEAPPSDFHWSPTYLGISRTAAVVFVQIFLNLGRTPEIKKALYARIAEKLAASPGLRKEDVLVNLVEVPRENWSFGNGVMSYDGR
jgi:phenylpyruvate tautomerase PptA (4-oxalocrotonate tautomerase family)